jgi:gliding motility-associated-like protein
VEVYWDNLGTPTLLYTDNTPTSGDGINGKTYASRYANFTLPQANKNYEIRFKAFSGGVCINETKQTILINPAPKVIFANTLPSICNDTTARQITQARETTGIVGNALFSGNGVNNSGLFNPRSVAAGTYNIQYKYTSTVGCADSATQPLKVWPSPIAKWGITSPICEKNAVTFTDTSVANANTLVTWRWNFGDGNTQQFTNGNPFNFTYLNASNSAYAVGLQVVTDSGCFSQYAIKPIKVNFLPRVSFTTPSICLPDGNGQFVSTSTIPDNSEGLFSYLWNFDDPADATPSTLQSPNKKYTALAPANGYQVKLKITTKDACVDSLTQAFTTVYPQPKANFDAIPTEVCIRDIIQFTDKTDGKTSAANRWVWNLDQGFTSTQQNPSRTFRDSGNFTITLYAFNAQNCVSDTVSKTVTVHPYPGVELGPNIYVLEGGTIPIKPTAFYGNQLNFKWLPASFLSSDTAIVPLCTPPDPSPFDSIKYTLTLTGIGGCAVDDDIFVVVLKQPKVPNAFSPNGDGINDRWVIQYIESYPNATVDVFNRYGQTVFSISGGYKNSNGWDGSFNGKPLPTGTYYYVINPRNGRQSVNGSVTIIR